MNLIEQLGGYERAKAFLNAASYTMDELIMMQRSGLRPQHVEKALLEYRRQHNIFEVGDKVFCEHFEMDEVKNILTVEIVRGHYLQLSDGVSCTAHLVRHATDEEIKTGKRLEVNQ